MPLPQISNAQIAWIIEQVAQYIQQQRQTYRGRAVPLDDQQRSALQPFFPGSVLGSTKVVFLKEERVSNPPFFPELQRMGFEPDSLPDFSLMAAITFVDTVVSHEPFTERLLFHELVHVVQHEKLGSPEFAAKYVKGFLNGGSYEAIPLEMNAYQLDARFAGAPTKVFSVAKEVQGWIDAGKL